MSAYDDALSIAQRLSIDDRLRLIDALWDSLPASESSRPSDAWIAEAQRRSAELDAGNMTAAPWSEVKQRARSKAGLDD